MKLLPAAVLLAAACAAQDVKPACNRRTEGQFWPKEANTDRTAIARLSRCGVLEVCGLRGWRYRWQPVAVHVSQLKKASATQIAGCEAEAEAKKE